jgi:hypothetical protein
MLMRLAGHGWAALWYVSVLALALATAILVRNWQIFSPPEDSDRSLKFLRVAYVWLFVSLAMLVLLPVDQILVTWLAPGGEAARIGFSHAYYGATRHAITVGFVSLMIVGVAAKVVPTLSGVDVRGLSRLWAPFVLINAGCLLRGVGQTLTDFSSLAFPVTGVSGLLEVTGLAMWGVHLVLIMAGRPRRIKMATTAGETDLSRRAIQPQDQVAAVLDDEPRLLATFLANGFTPLSNPLARRTLARVVTLRQACRQLHLDEPRFVAELNDARARFRARELPTVVSLRATCRE